jgi:hypothetical protein
MYLELCAVLYHDFRALSLPKSKVCVRASAHMCAYGYRLEHDLLALNPTGPLDLRKRTLGARRCTVGCRM